MTGIFAMILYIGCYTTPEKPNGLALVDFDAATGKMTLVESYRIDNPLYFAKSPDGKYLYSNEADGLGSFEIGKSGKLRHVDAVKFGAKAMCHLALMPGGETLTWAAYASGEAGLINVKDGRFMSEVRHDRHEGRGPDPRQASAHCHEAVPTPDGGHYVVVDLGLDALVTYSAEDPGAQGVVFKTEPAGAGPRHLVFHPDGRHAFVVFELGSRIASYSWSEEVGFKMLDSCSTLPEDWHGLNQDAAIRFTPDVPAEKAMAFEGSRRPSKRVVVSNRGYDSLTVFDFDLATGKLSLKARSVLPGSWPRDFLFIPGTDFAVVTMERSNTLLSVRYDAKTGVFTPVDTLHGLYRPVAALY